MNELTTKLMNIIDGKRDENKNRELDDRIMDIKTLLGASDAFADRESLSRMTIDYEYYRRGRYGVEEHPVLNYAIVKKEPEIANLLFHHVLETKTLETDDKRQKVLLRAVMCCCEEENEELLTEILDTGIVAINDEDTSKLYESKYPISLAAHRRKEAIVRRLLQYGADPGKEHIHTNHYDDGTLKSTIYCGKALADARKAYEQGDTAALYKHLAQAIKLDGQFVVDYCKTQATCAVNQSSKEHLRHYFDKTDYRFLLAFIRAIANILTSSLNDNNKYEGYKVIQEEVLSVLNAYCFKTEIETPLFTSTKALASYLNENNAKPLIEDIASQEAQTTVSGSENGDGQNNADAPSMGAN